MLSFKIHFYLNILRIANIKCKAQKQLIYFLSVHFNFMCTHRIERLVHAKKVFLSPKSCHFPIFIQMVLWNMRSWCLMFIQLIMLSPTSTALVFLQVATSQCIFALSIRHTFVWFAAHSTLFFTLNNLKSFLNLIQFLYLSMES